MQGHQYERSHLFQLVVVAEVVRIAVPAVIVRLDIAAPVLRLKNFNPIP
jgi:hypothetical protein